ncbi:hypothetical protein An02g06540 [Aspergillus niger]|uniref:Uncharacterized protein n=3 Tax=Aspergillus niger TaxID=5061 RepID=A2QDC0_ASPNC|nr:hypothetical protein An02g06540 [Aspergillus niger]CAL00652.1 hypothetical protein An02g06540 [Aspergillus niger]
MDRPDHPINDPVMGFGLKIETSPTIIANFPKPERNQKLPARQGKIAYEWSVKDAASPTVWEPVLEEEVVVVVVAVPYWRIRAGADECVRALLQDAGLGLGTRPRIAGEALAVTGTAALVPQPKLKSLGRRWPPINPSRTLVSRSSMAQMSRRMQASSGRFRAGRPATGWNIDARLSQQLGLKRRGEPGVWQLACASLPVPYAFFLSPPCRAEEFPRYHQLSKLPYNCANFPSIRSCWVIRLLSSSEKLQPVSGPGFLVSGGVVNSQGLDQSWLSTTADFMCRDT